MMPTKTLFCTTNFTDGHKSSHITIARMNHHPEKSTSVAREGFVKIRAHLWE